MHRNTSSKPELTLEDLIHAYTPHIPPHVSEPDRTLLSVDEIEQVKRSMVKSSSNPKPNTDSDTDLDGKIPGCVSTVITASVPRRVSSLPLLSFLGLSLHTVSPSALPI